MIQLDNISSDERDPIEILADDFVMRKRNGDQATIEEYAVAYPHLAQDIRDLFPTMLAMEQVRAQRAEICDSKKSLNLKITRLGDLRVIAEIGRGGMGVVYEAEQESLGRRVAVKVLPKTVMLTEKQLQRFDREARTAARLHHTNIVPVFGVGEQDGCRYYVMQLISGASLEQVIASLRRQAAVDGEETIDLNDSTLAITGVVKALLRDDFESAVELPGSAATSDFPATAEFPANKFPASEDVHSAPTVDDVEDEKIAPNLKLSSAYWRGVARIGMQASEALAYAHQQHILHRDIKPGNLLLDPQGVLWVADFGLAKALESNAVTGTGDVVGTPRFMAPEQFSGDATPLSDIYSLGLTLYELLTLQPVHKSGMRRGEPPKRPRSIHPKIPRDLETIVLKAIELEPSQRYASAEEMAADLERFLADEPIQARRSSIPARLWRWSRRNPALALANSIAAFLLIMVAGVSLWGYITTQKAHAKTTDANKVTEAALLREQEARSRAEEASSQVALALDREKEQRSRAEYASDLANAALLREQEERDRAFDASELATEALDRIFASLAPDTEYDSIAPSLQDEAGVTYEAPFQPRVSVENAALLEQLVTYYDELAIQQGDNNDLRYKTADAYRRVGAIRMRLGQFPEAHAAYERALSEFDALLSLEPYDVVVQIEVARLHNDLAIAERHQREHESSRGHLEAAITLLESIDEPTATARFELARSFYSLSKNHSHRRGASRESNPGRRGPSRARETDYLAKAIEILEELTVDQDTANPSHLRLLGLCYREPTRRRHHDPARETYAEKALAIFTKLASDFPDAPDLRLDLLETHELISGGMFTTRAFNSKQESHLRSALEIAHGLVRQHPQTPEYAVALGRVSYALASQLGRSNRFDEAEPFFRDAISVQRKSTEDGLANHKIWLAISQKSLAEYLVADNREREAIELFRDAESIVNAIQVETESPVTAKFGMYLKHRLQALSPTEYDAPPRPKSN